MVDTNLTATVAIQLQPHHLLALHTPRMLRDAHATWRWSIKERGMVQLKEDGLLHPGASWSVTD